MTDFIASGTKRQVKSTALFMIKAFRLAILGRQSGKSEEGSRYAKLERDVARALCAPAHGEEAGCEYVSQPGDQLQQTG